MDGERESADRPAGSRHRARSDAVRTLTEPHRVAAFSERSTVAVFGEVPKLLLPMYTRSRDAVFTFTVAASTHG